MSKFIKKPVVIEAEQWFPGKPVPGVCDDIPKNKEYGVIYQLCGCCLIGYDSPGPHVHTCHGGRGVPIEPGDWIIEEPNKDGYYPCQPDIFEKFYEPYIEPKPQEWIPLADLRPGAVFTTKDGILAMKTEYSTFNGGIECDCYLLASGEAAHFKNKDKELVSEIQINA
jgi:hypothetical protein